MRLQYEQPKGSRVKTRFRGIWRENDYMDIGDCRSVRAFRRRLKSLPKGVEYILLGLWQNYNVYGWGSAE